MSPLGGQCVKVVVTGAAGQLAYSLLPLISSGRMLGPAQRVQLRLLDIEPAMNTLKGVSAELVDCAYPLLESVVISHTPEVAFEGADVLVFCGSAPLMPGMERKDLLQANAKMFREQGRILGEVAAPDCRVCVVSNPANTIAHILLKAAGGKIKPKNVTALTRLDHNRATALLAERAGVPPDSVKNCIVWGNHSNTQVPDVNSATVKGVPAREFVKDDAFFDGEFMAMVRQRGVDVIKWRGRSSALSAAKAIADHVHDWVLGTPEGTHVSMAVHSDGNPYGVPAGLIFSFPVTCSGGEWHFAEKLCVTPSVAEHMKTSTAELETERAQADEI